MNINRIHVAALCLAASALMGAGHSAQAYDLLLPAGSGAVGTYDRGMAFATRGLLMADDANLHGAADQLGQALAALPDGYEYEKTVWANTLAKLSLPGTDGMKLVEDFLLEYPSSARRQLALMAIGDLLYDKGDYAAALKAYGEVSADALDSASADALMYHTAFCLLRIGEYDRAAAILTPLTSVKAYRDNAGFYLGYIDYIKGNYTEAARRMEAVADNAEMPAAMAGYYLAQIYYLKHDYKQAAAMAQRLTARTDVEPEYRSEALRIAGESLYETGAAREALPYLEEYVATTSEPQPSALYILGVTDYRNGKYKEAIDRLTPVAQDLTAMGQSAYLFIGEAYMQLGNYNAASMALEKAAMPGGDEAVMEAAFYNLAVAKMQGGKTPFGNSAAMLEEFLQRFPRSQYVPQVADYLVKGYMNDNNYQAALDAINRVQRPTDKELALKQTVLYSLGTRELQRGEARKAITHLTEAASMKRYSAQTAAEATLWLGEAQYKTGDFAGAARSFNEYLRSANDAERNRPMAYYDLGYARFAMKQYKDAKADFRRFLKAPGAADKYMIADAGNRLGDCDYYLRDFAAAAESYQAAYEANPAGGDYSVFQQGIMKGLQRQYREKIDILTDLTDRFPSSALLPTALLEIAESYGELGETGRAVESYTALTARYPSTDQGRQAQLMLAITYLNSGNTASAMTHYRKVIEMYPSSEQARVAAEDLKQLYAQQGRVDEYLRFINNVPEAPKPDSAEVAELTLRSAEAARDKGRFADAARLAAEVVEKYPDSPQAVEALSIQAESTMQTGDVDSALACYKALEQKASDAATLNAARLGIMRVSRDMGDNATALQMADVLLDSPMLGSTDKADVAFTKALALSETGHGNEAVAIWEELAREPQQLTGTKSAIYLAQYHFDNKHTEKALESVNALIEANPPHDYWLARGFILLSDILRAKGEKFEADEYLRSLRKNYPGEEPDIFRMIDERLDRK